MNGVVVASSWSGGKDSCLALYKALQQGYQVKYLLHFISKESKRSCFHGIESRFMRMQADSLGITLIQKEVTADMAEYEKEFKAAVTELKKDGIKGLVCGDIYLLEHQNWIERVCRELKVDAIEPLWERPTEGIIDEFVGLGFEAVIVSAKADLFGEDFIGRRIDQNFIAGIDNLKKKNICPCGENGEFHSFVVDGPIFKESIQITKSKPVLKDGFWRHWFLDIQECKTVKKQ